MAVRPLSLGAPLDGDLEAQAPAKEGGAAKLRPSPTHKAPRGTCGACANTASPRWFPTKPGGLAACTPLALPGNVLPLALHQ